MRPAPVPQLQFEFADASKDDRTPRASRRLLRRAKDVRAALGSLAYEAQWGHLLRTGSDATQRMGWQLLSSARPQVGRTSLFACVVSPLAERRRGSNDRWVLQLPLVPGSWSQALGAPAGTRGVRSQ